MEPKGDKIRLDKWLWFARFFKTRGLATRIVAGGHVRVNSAHVTKASHAVGPGDTLTFPQGNRIRVARILSVGTRRGPATEAQTLYEDLTPEPDPVPKSPGFEGKGRPTKKDRRKLDLSRRQALD
ncbi:MAG: RNA-binding S4 domain-containing protein [Rhodobacteraceae bacterium]|nr:RNA-binding S4 domain-containing protein [Paracoccaceae bacterium]